MLRWLLLVLVVAGSVVVFTKPSLESTERRVAPSQCQVHAWVRAPDMVPGDVIAGDVKIKFHESCTDTAESYTLGLRYKEKMFWRLSPYDVPIYNRRPPSNGQYALPISIRPIGFRFNPIGSVRDVFRRVRQRFQKPGNPNRNPGQNMDLWSVHEEERVAFEIKAPLVDVEGADPLPTDFTTRFGILVPNTNYPPGLDWRRNAMPHMPYMRGPDTVSSESAYEYFVEIRFSNGTTVEIPAGMTSFTPFSLSTNDEAPSINISLENADPGFNKMPLRSLADRLRSNYTIEVSFPDGAHVYRNSSVNITATVHRTGYTSRTDTPVKLCVFPSGSSIVEWYPQEFKGRSQPFSPPLVKALVPSMNPTGFPSMQHSRWPVARPPFYQPECREVNLTTASADLTHEGHIYSTSSEPLSLSFHVDDDVVPDFSTYYQRLGYRFNLNLYVKPDPSESPEYYETDQAQWEQLTRWMDETDVDWLPWLPPKQTRRRYLTGDASLTVISIEKQPPAQSTPVHYLSDEARQPTFVKFSDIADLLLMSPEERDLIAPLAQPSIKVFPRGEERPNQYFHAAYYMQWPIIYVGDTWVNKVLAAEDQRERDTMDHLLVVQ
ncbi:hypothetical protein DFH29DRAFT_562133 [Suillus ampliporus]|nr:hypothetical protein DFH29DRAFT_562133 [Suillus ampliporus]